MRILTSQESNDVVRRSGVSVADGVVSLIAGGKPSTATVALPSSSGRQAFVADRIFEECVEAQQWLIWILAWGIWPTEEYPEIWMELRARYGDERPLLEAPGHLLGAAERDLARGLFRLAILFGWDALLVPDPATVVASISHDELIFLYSADGRILETLRHDLEPAAGDHASR